MTWFKPGPTYSVHSVCSGSVTSQSRQSRSPGEVKVMRVQDYSYCRTKKNGNVESSRSYIFFLKKDDFVAKDGVVYEV